MTRGVWTENPLVQGKQDSKRARRRKEKEEADGDGRVADEKFVEG